MHGPGTLLLLCAFAIAPACLPQLEGASADSSLGDAHAQIEIPWEVGLYSTNYEGETARVTAETLVVIDDKTGDAKSVPGVTEQDSPNRPTPKARPRLKHGMSDQPGLPDIFRTSPLIDESRRFLQSLFDKINQSWAASKWKRSIVWDPNANLQLTFSVDLDKGVVSLESRSSPIEDWVHEEFRAAIASLTPVKVPAVLRPQLPPKLHLKFYFSHAEYTGPDKETWAQNFILNWKPD